MTNIPAKFKELKKVYRKHQDACEYWKEAHQILSDDRNPIAGKIYETQNQVNTLVGELIAMVDQEESEQK